MQKRDIYAQRIYLDERAKHDSFWFLFLMYFLLKQKIQHNSKRANYFCQIQFWKL